MKIIANDYDAKDICRIIREWTGLTQDKFGKSIYRSGRSVRKLESGESSMKLETLLFIAKIHGIKIIIEKV